MLHKHQQNTLTIRRLTVVRLQKNKLNKLNQQHITETKLTVQVKTIDNYKEQYLVCSTRDDNILYITKQHYSLFYTRTSYLESIPSSISLIYKLHITSHQPHTTVPQMTY